MPSPHEGLTGDRILCVEQAEGSVSGLERWAPESGIRYALVFGNEVDGVQQRVADLCDGAPSRYLRAEPSTRSTFPWRAGIVLWEAYRRWLGAGRINRRKIARCRL